MIWNESKECMSIDEMYLLQSARLIKMVHRVYQNVNFYRKKMQIMGIEPGDIKGIEDLNKLPFTTKDDLRENYPLGLLAIPESEVIRIHASSGTTGKATVVGYSKKDIENWKECVTRVLTMANIGKNDKVQVAYGYGLFTGGLGVHYGAENLGATVIPISTGNTKRQVTMMEDLGCTAIACTPSYLLHIIEVLEEQDKLNDIRLKTAILGAETWSENMRREIENKLKIHTYDIYGISEVLGPGVAGDCEMHEGLHVFSDHFVPEIINSKTLESVSTGEIGELVFTTITKEALPLFRYRTKDLTSITYEKCDCGRTLPRIARIRGRSDDMLIIRGVNVFPSQVESSLLEIGKTSAHYLLVVDRINNQDTLEVWIEACESLFKDDNDSLEDLTKVITKLLQDDLGLAVKVKLVEPKTLQRSEGKAVRVIDKRKIF
ncbi:MAG: paaK2 [Anaerocolumna sp.]|jgi:phenylacetate-CoA ligase|nr:paaK2 [Anaerocolumna sp.]